MKKAINRTLSAFLSLCMLVGLIPAMEVSANTTALPSDIVGVDKTTPVEPVVQIGLDAFSPYSQIYGHDILYFGKDDPERWLVLDTKANTGADGLFVLAEDIQGDLMSFDADNNNAWQGSDIQAWAQAYLADGANFAEKERAAMLAVTKSDSAFTVKEYLEDVNFNTNWSIPAVTDILKNEKLFLPSAEELSNPTYGLSTNLSRIAKWNNGATGYWTRSPIQNSNDVAIVQNHGEFSAAYAAASTLTKFDNASNAVSHEIRPRPAFNLKSDGVVFTTAADNSGHQTFGLVSQKSNQEWKTAIKDENRSFATDASVDKTAVITGETVTITHLAPKEINNAYNVVTAALVNSAGEVVAYGSINEDMEALSSQFVIPAGLEPGEYELWVQGELWKPAEISDYASAYPFKTTITVEESVTLTLKTDTPNAKWSGKEFGDMTPMVLHFRPNTNYDAWAYLADGYRLPGKSQVDLIYGNFETSGYAGMVTGRTFAYYLRMTQDMVITLRAPISADDALISLGGTRIHWYTDPNGDTFTHNYTSAIKNAENALYFKPQDGYFYRDTPSVEGGTVTAADNGFYKLTFTPTEDMTLAPSAPLKDKVTVTLKGKNVTWYSDPAGEAITSYKGTNGAEVILYWEVADGYFYLSNPTVEGATVTVEDGYYKVVLTPTEDITLTAPSPLQNATATLAGEHVSWYEDPTGEPIGQWVGSNGDEVILYLKPAKNFAYTTTPIIDGATVEAQEDGSYKVTFTLTGEMTLTAPTPASAQYVYTLDTLDGIITWYDTEDMLVSVTTYVVPAGENGRLWFKLHPDYAYYTCDFDIDGLKSVGWYTGNSLRDHTYSIDFTPVYSTTITLDQPDDYLGYTPTVEVGDTELYNDQYTVDGESKRLGMPNSREDSYAYFNEGVLTLKDFQLSGFSRAIDAEDSLTVYLIGENRIESSTYSTLYVYGDVTFVGTGSLTVVGPEESFALNCFTVTLKAGPTLMLEAGAAIAHPDETELILPEEYEWRTTADGDYINAATTTLTYTDESVLHIRTLGEPDLPILDKHTHPFCGETCEHTDTAHSSVPFTPWTATDALPDQTGEYVLTADVVLNNTWQVPEGGLTALCLNGYSITYQNKEQSAPVIAVGYDASLLICDCNQTDKTYWFDGNDRDVWKQISQEVIVPNTSTRAMPVSGGIITGGTDAGILNLGSLTLFGGTVVGNSGGGVINDDGFIMYGGDILGNITGSAGGGVLNGGFFLMESGSICYNMAYRTARPASPNLPSVPGESLASAPPEDYPAIGGGLYNYGNAIILGGGIAYNMADMGGGVYHEYAEGESILQLSGSPVIFQNYADSEFDNLHLRTGSTVKIVDISNTSIGVTMETKTGLFSEAGSEYIDCFFSDKIGYTVTATDAGLELVTDTRLVPTLTVRFNDFVQGETPDFPEIDYSGDSQDLEILFAPKGSNVFLPVLPSEVGEYTVKVYVYETETYQAVWTTVDFSILPASLLYGDVDVNGTVTAADALLALQAATKKIALTERQQLLADVDGDGAVAAGDALLILQYATKKIASFPVETLD